MEAVCHNLRETTMWFTNAHTPDSGQWCRTWTCRAERCEPGFWDWRWRGWWACLSPTTDSAALVSAGSDSTPCTPSAPENIQRSARAHTHTSENSVMTYIEWIHLSIMFDSCSLVFFFCCDSVYLLVSMHHDKTAGHWVDGYGSGTGAVHWNCTVKLHTHTHTLWVYCCCIFNSTYDGQSRRCELTFSLSRLYTWISQSVFAVASHLPSSLLVRRWTGCLEPAYQIHIRYIQCTTITLQANSSGATVCVLYFRSSEAFKPLFKQVLYLLTTKPWINYWISRWFETFSSCLMLLWVWESVPSVNPTISVHLIPAVIEPLCHSPISVLIIFHIIIKTTCNANTEYVYCIKRFHKCAAHNFTIELQTSRDTGYSAVLEGTEPGNMYKDFKLLLFIVHFSSKRTTQLTADGAAAWFFWINQRSSEAVQHEKWIRNLVFVQLIWFYSINTHHSS